MTACEVKEFGGISDTAKLAPYYKRGCLLCGRYRVEICKKDEVECRKKEQERAKTISEKDEFIRKFGLKMYSEWETLNRRYGSKLGERHGER